ncbi:DNA replication/repair protein RecF [Bacillota bacterium]
MLFLSAKLHNFRNYHEQTVFFHPEVNIFRGNNAQGKTNLLESLYIMSLGKSFRTNRDSDMIGFKGDYSSAKCTYLKNAAERNMEIIFSQLGKSLIIDGYKAKKTNEILDNVYVVSFTPEDMKIVKEEPEKRRKFIDRELCQLKPIYYSNLQRYKKVLMQRNSFLRQGNVEEELLEVWDKSLVEYGSRIIKDRKEFVDHIKNISKKIHKDITKGKENIDIFYEASVPYRDKKEEIAADFHEQLNKDRKRDLKTGTTGSGPHRDDLRITIDDIDLRNFGSQGQQRTAALSLKLSEIEIIKAEKKEAPVLLLDDVLSELDEARQEYLIKSFSDVQLFITTADNKESLWTELPAKKIFTIENGQCF